MTHGAPIEFLDLKILYREIKAEIDAAIGRVAASGWYIGGDELSSFETNFARYCESRYCVGTANGLDALSLALRALGVGPGDEVIVSSNTFIATWLAVTSVGATPVPAEPDPLTHNLDPAMVEPLINERTRVLLPTHLYGQPADLDPLLALARKHGLRVVEDGAQAHGARYKGRRIGGHGDVVTWSFYPGKNLGAFGDAGAITTNDADLAAQVRMLGNYGGREKYVNEVIGVNSRLDPFQAAILDVKLKHLDRWNEARAKLAAHYCEWLGGLSIQVPHVPSWAEPSWHLFVIRSPQRDGLALDLAKLGIQTLIHYPIPPHLQQAYKDAGYVKGDFPIAEMLADEVLSLPIGPHLPVEQAKRVADAIRGWSARGASEDLAECVRSSG